MDEEFEKKLMDELKNIIREANEGNIKIIDHLEKLRIDGGELDIATIYSMHSKNTSETMVSYSDHINKILSFVREAKIRMGSTRKKGWLQ